MEASTQPPPPVFANGTFAYNSEAGPSMYVMMLLCSLAEGKA
jgi:hypothetical protein